MLTHTVNDQRAWRTRTVDDRSKWYYPLTPRCLSAIDQTIQHLRRDPRPITEMDVFATPCAECADDLKPVYDALETGRGFAIINGLPAGKYSLQERQMIYWLLGQVLGQPFEQNVQKTLLYDVKDTGQDVRYGARFSVTNSESSFHTDNSFGTALTDYVGLLCLNTAKSGGLNQVVSVFSVHNELLAKHRAELEVLYQPFHIDRRGGTLAGESPTIQFPILQWNGKELIVRYLRYWIEVGHEKAGLPLTPAQIHAMDVFDQVARDSELVADFALKPDDMFFINNRWILHNRTAFEDFEEADRRRHLVRLWLRDRSAARVG